MSKWRRLWEYVIFIISITPLWEVSFCLLFLRRGPSVVFYIPFMIFDILYALDIYVVLHTSFLSRGVAIHERHRVIAHYGPVWLLLHYISAIPFSWLSLVWRSWWHYLWLAAPRLCRLRRAIVASATVRRLLVYDSWGSVLVPLIVVWFLFIHLFACLFYFCGMLEGYFHGGSWVLLHGWRGHDLPRQYVISVYFITTTIFTCGTGDLCPLNTSEMVLVWFVELIGVTMNAFLLGKIVARLLDPHGRRFLFAYESFLSFLRFKRIDKRIEREITHYFAYKWVTGHGADDPQQVYRQLPETIRNHLKRDTCERFLINVSLFRMASDPLRLLIAKALKPIEFAPGHTIVRQGDVSSDLLLLASGFIDVFMDDRRYAAMVACADGQSFGLQELLGPDLPRTVTIKAVTHVGGWRLTRADLQAAVAQKPDMKEQLLEIVRLLFPDFCELVTEMLSEGAVDRLANVSDGSEGGMGLGCPDHEHSG
jgi:hypothetical protein